MLTCNKEKALSVTGKLRFNGLDTKEALGCKCSWVICSGHSLKRHAFNDEGHTETWWH